MKRSRTKWNFDVEMDSGISGPPVASRPDEGMPTATTQDRDSHSTSTCTSARRSRSRNASTRSARESTQDHSILVRNQGSKVRSRCVLKDFATTVRDDVFAPTPSPSSVRGLLLCAAWFNLRVETGYLVCASMQADNSCEMFARLPKGQERDGWIWRLLGAMNGKRTASRDFTEFLAGGTWVSNVANWRDVSRTKHEWYLMWTALSSVPSQQRLKNSGCRSRSWS